MIEIITALVFAAFGVFRAKKMGMYKADIIQRGVAFALAGLTLALLFTVIFRNFI